MRTIYNLMLTALLLGLAATAAHAQFEFAAKHPLQVQGTMSAATLSSEIALAAPDGSTYLLGAFDTEFEFAGKALKPGKGGTNSFLVKYNADGTEAWGMYITNEEVYTDSYGDENKGNTKIQSATMVGENVLVAVKISGTGVMVAADGVTTDTIKGNDGDLRVVLLQISPNAELIGDKKELLVEDNLAMEPDPALNISAMDVLNGQLWLAGNLTGSVSLAGSSTPIIESNTYDLFGFMTISHSIAFCVCYDVDNDVVTRIDTIRPRGIVGKVQFLSMATSGDDVYLAFNVQDTVGSGVKEWISPRTNYIPNEPFNLKNSLLLIKMNISTGLVWDKQIIVEDFGNLQSQPFVNPYAMEVVGDKLLMGGLFSVGVDFGNGKELNTLATTPSPTTTDYFFAIANTSDGQVVDAFAFGNVDNAEPVLPNGHNKIKTDYYFREQLQLVTDGYSVFLMGAYKGQFTSPAGTLNSINGSVDNFLLSYNMGSKKWDGMSFGGATDDYASSLCMIGDTLLVAGQYSNSIALNSATSLENTASSGYNAFCVRYTQAQFAIALNATTNGSLLTSPASGALAGRTVTITTTPVSGYRLKEGSLKVYETGNPTNVVELSGNSFAMPRFAVTVEAEFEEVPIRSLQVQASPAEGGSISGQSTGNFDDGTAVTLTATPASGYRFVKWVEGATDISTDNPYTFSITADRTLVAVFEKITGLLDARIEPLSVHPNPTTGMLWVSVPELVEGTAAEVLVYNATGQLVLRIPSQGASAGSAASRISIDLNSYPSGLYIIRAGNAVAKVLKM
ncbi:MAG: T9SS type A sorting domain-containing protein [Bacteroidales bacterium]|nr:T9SS type A sorting domain-containing protein [Bacteroidales bacterium]